MNKFNLRLEDEVFEFRNKAYGAYAIRASYSENMTRGFFIALLSISIFLIVIIKITHQVVSEEIDKIFTINEMDDPNVEVARIIPKRILIAAPRSETTPMTNVDNTPTVVNDNTEIKPSEELKTASTVSSSVVENSGGSDIEGANTGTSEGTASTGNAVIEMPQEKVEPVIMSFVSQMPAFPGGETALYAFLNKHTRYPQLAIDNGISGTVVVQFVINATGNIEKVKVVRGIGGGCDQEAIRVVESMPNWAAGKHMDKAVPVRLTLPIKFALKN